MKNFENITKNLDVFMKFADKNNWEISCDFCPESPEVCDNDCCSNLRKYLESMVSVDSEIGKNEFSMFYSELKSASTMKTTDYTSVNYTVNTMNKWVEEGKQLNESQKEQLREFKSDYIKKLENLKRLEELFKLID